jgi:putative nucleotidyltransferase with HDIG domain
LSLLFAKTVELVLLQSNSFVLEAVRYPIIVPFAALLFSILFNSRISLFFSTFLSIILGVTLAVDHAYFLVINLVTSLIVIITTRSLRKRTDVFGVCGECLLGVIPIILAYSFINNRLWSISLLTNFISSLICLLVIGILVVGLLPALESTFNVLTDITLMEFMDPNNELLRRLTLEIPGTYQHSLVLGNLAEAAALSIKADGLFCRVATMYHDIGKLNNPNYFTENQGPGAVNIHQLLTPLESAQVIISHVKDGEMLAKKYRLPQPFIDILKEHHGTTLVYYFYHKEIELKDNNPSKVDSNAFRYPGPKPKSKESAIIMIADGVEAASRSLEVVNEDTLSEMINRLVNEKAQDGQFDDCCLTFEELKIVKETLVKTLLLTRHVRIKYPQVSLKKLEETIC